MSVMSKGKVACKGFYMDPWWQNVVIDMYDPSGHIHLCLAKDLWKYEFLENKPM